MKMEENYYDSLLDDPVDTQEDNNAVQEPEDDRDYYDPAKLIDDNEPDNNDPDTNEEDPDLDSDKNTEDDDDAITSYLQAVLAARTNDASTLASSLKNAIQQDATLAKRAANDLEFANYESAIKSLLK